jgi:hypothetical protein
MDALSFAIVGVFFGALIVCVRRGAQELPS